MQGSSSSSAPLSWRFEGQWAIFSSLDFHIGVKTHEITIWREEPSINQLFEVNYLVLSSFWLSHLRFGWISSGPVISVSDQGPSPQRTGVWLSITPHKTGIEGLHFLVWIANWFWWRIQEHCSHWRIQFMRVNYPITIVHPTHRCWWVLVLFGNPFLGMSVMSHLLYSNHFKQYCNMAICYIYSIVTVLFAIVYVCTHYTYYMHDIFFVILI